MKFEFHPIADAAYLEISDEEVESTRQIEPGIMADYDAHGHIVGIEIRAGASNLLEMQSGSEMSGVVGSGLEFSGEADGAGFVGAKEI